MTEFWLLCDWLNFYNNILIHDCFKYLSINMQINYIFCNVWQEYDQKEFEYLVKNMNNISKKK